jgi:hypothetical protein
MNNIAETCGGVGVACMTYRTQFEIETERLSDLLNKDATAQLGKIAVARDRLAKFFDVELKKRAPTADYLAKLKALTDACRAELDALRKTMAEANLIAERRREALPDFRAWALGQHARPMNSYTATKVVTLDGDADTVLSPLRIERRRRIGGDQRGDAVLAASSPDNEPIFARSLSRRLPAAGDRLKGQDLFRRHR